MLINLIPIKALIMTDYNCQFRNKMGNRFDDVVSNGYKYAKRKVQVNNENIMLSKRVKKSIATLRAKLQPSKHSRLCDDGIENMLRDVDFCPFERVLTQVKSKIRNHTILSNNV